MRTLDARAVRFGELAGPLVHGPAFFDWKLVSTQEFTAALDYSFEQLIADGEIPYAPAATRTRIERYPSIGDSIAVETTPVHVGEHRLDLRYEFIDGTGDAFGAGQISHVTIDAGGRAKPLPASTREQLHEMAAEKDDIVFDWGRDILSDMEYTYRDSFEIRRPLVEGVELAYFEEYPRLATIALERYLEEQGVSLHEIDGRQPFKLKQWDWNFTSPVAYGTTLNVNATVVDVTPESVLVFHTFTDEGRTCIEGWTEYGCFDTEGNPNPFENRLLEAISPE